MKADFSRLRVDDASGDEWLQQQGRLWLDSDWNEATLARLRRLELHVRDVVGALGRPDPGTAFRLGDGGNGELTIGGGAGPAGHLYLDGILAANPTRTTYATQPDYPGAPPLPLPSATSSGWQLVGDMGTARAGHGAAPARPGPLAPVARVLVCGGTSAGAVTSTAELFDPVTATWSPTPAMGVARAWHSVTVLPNRRILVAGGLGPAGLALATAELYDPATGTWTATAPLARARFGHTATMLADGRLLVAGGFARTGGSLGPTSGTDALADAEIYTPATGTWTTVASMTRPRGRHTAVRLGRPPLAGAVLVCGGHREGAAEATAELYDPASDQWRSAPDLAGAREGHTMTLLSDGRALVVGGLAAGQALSSCELFDPVAQVWRSAAALASARTGHCAARVVAGQVLVAGGHRGDRPLTSAELYDPGADRWTAGRPLAEARAWHSATVLDDGSILAAGGSSALDPAAGAGGETPAAELLDPVETTVAVAYLEVWRRLVGYLQEDRREVALGGPDTTVQLRTVAQVKVVAVPAAHRPATLDGTHAAAYLPDDGTGRLSTVVSPTAPPQNPCDVPAGGTYTGRENRLYRVEIHDSGEMLGALAPSPVPLTADAPGGSAELAVGELTAPQRAALLVGGWDLVAGPGPTALREAVSVSFVDDTGVVRLTLPTRHNGYTVAGGAALVPRRDVARLAEPAPAGATSLRLVPGEGPSPAETAAGRLARRGWYVRTGESAEPVAVVSYDPETGLATLAGPLRSAYPRDAELVPRARYKWSADNASFATAVTAVLRTDLTTATTTLQVGSLGRDRAGMLRVGDLVEICGDTDELGPGHGLLCRIAADPDPDALTVTLDTAHPLLTPARNAEVRADHVVLRRWDGLGFVGPEDVDLGEGVKVRFSGYDFRASSYWWFTTRARDASVEDLDGVPPHGTRRHRTPLAVLHWRGDPETGITLDRAVDCVPVFDPLTDLQARHVRYDDSRTALGASNVQEAIEALAPKTHPRVRQDGISWRNDRPLPVTTFNQGLTVRFTEPMAPATLTDRTVEIWLHVPDPTEPLVHALRVPCIVTAGPDQVGVRPRTELDPIRVGQWRDRLRLVDGSPDLRAVVVLHGDKILDAAGRRPLDGTVFGRLTRDGYDTVTDLRLPSGDGRAGGRFESWLFLTGPPAPPRVAGVEPAAGASLAAAPPAIHVMFTKDVSRESVTAADRVVVRGPGGVRVSGSVEPFPFTPAADTWSGLTFTPATPGWAGAGTYTLTLSSAIVDSGGLGLDGDGDGTPSDFSASFTFGPPPAPVPVRVTRISPPDGAQLQEFPAVIRVEFDKLVQRNTLTAQSVEVGMAPLEDPVAFTTVDGTITPFGEAAPGMVRGFTFAPADRDSLIIPGLFVVDLHGEGAHVILDVDGMPLDGQSNGRPSRFSSSFEVGEVR
ncbi:kelch repeat-containing protein [Streptomyces coeruleoprunus]|uniref:Kelch repeat-containing protein n=1 Tax=Streptomyces coeruleoprunus TaxID=285563 RepID=A0ABV9XBE8_9ACTN